jgi:hypothetical protein
MDNAYTIRLKAVDCFQLLDALTSRAEAYERTMSYFRGETNNATFCEVEECRDMEEAASIAKHFRDIINNVESQIQTQKSTPREVR